ncbi:MAG: hypothetical protein PHE55_13655 [Methylococcaceae bacterium]|nr:hypothetical protein [Methylococcaceae bacterium]
MIVQDEALRQADCFKVIQKAQRHEKMGAVRFVVGCGNFSAVSKTMKARFFANAEVAPPKPRKQAKKPLNGAAS